MALLLFAVRAAVKTTKIVSLAGAPLIGVTKKLFVPLKIIALLLYFGGVPPVALLPEPDLSVQVVRTVSFAGSTPVPAGSAASSHIMQPATDVGLYVAGIGVIGGDRTAVSGFEGIAGLGMVTGGAEKYAWFGGSVSPHFQDR